MRNTLTIIVFILSIACSYAQVDITPNQLTSVEIEKIISTETTSYMGNSISFSNDGSVLAIGEYGYVTPSSVDSGRVQVYSNDTGSWIQKGQDIVGTGDNFNTFGKKVVLSADGNTLAVYDSQIAVQLNAGQTLQSLFGSLAVEYFPYIQVYQYSNNTWSQLGNDFLFNGIEDYSDMSLSGDGLSLAIATKTGTNVYEWTANTWSITGQQIPSTDVSFDDKISLSNNGDTLIVGDPFYSDPNSASQFSYEGQVKVYQNISNTWTQIGNTINGSDFLGYFGSLVSISSDGNTIAIGTAQTNNNDYVAILEFVGNNWISKGTNIAQIGNDIISMELADDGDAIVIGEAYSARVLKYNTDWEQVNVAVEGDVATDQLGYAVTISGDGDLFAAGAPSIETTGANGYVSVYEHNKNSVTRFGNEIYGYGTQDRLGSSVAVSGNGNIIAVGANGSSNNSGTLEYGHVRVFEKTANGLQQIGVDIRSTTDFDSGSFGTEVALNADGTLLAISAPFLFTSNWGAVYTYERIGNDWSPLGNIIYGVSGSRTGTSIAFSEDGSILAVGSGGNPGGVSNDQYTGYTTVYNYNDTNNTWDVLGQQINGEAEWDFSGASIDLSGDGTVVAIGAIGNDGATATGGHGHVRVFEYVNSNWVQKGTDVDGDPSFNRNFGGFVTLSNDGNTMLISDIDSQSSAGSVEIFSWNQISNDWTSEQLLRTFTSSGPNNGHRFKFGSDTAISDDNNIIVVGEHLASSRGKAHIYIKNETGTWVENDLFLAGTHNNNQYFGGNLSLSGNGNTLVVSSSGHNENGTRTGMAGVYHVNLCSTIDGFETFTGAVATPVTPSDNLIVNGSAEIIPITDNAWTAVSGNWEWPISNNQGVPVEFGHKYFRSTVSGTAEIYHDVDVSSFSATIDTSSEYFYFSTYLQSFQVNGVEDDSQVIVEYRDATGNVLSTYDTGLSQNTQAWTLFENTRLAPVGTRTIRVRLIAINNNQFRAPAAFIDDLYLNTTSNPSLISIPDPNLEQALITLGIDTDGIINGVMLQNDTIGVTSLDVSNQNITDLTGIEHFTDLLTLFAVDNNLTTIDVSQNTALTGLVLTLNNLSSVDVSNNTNLSTLILSNNQITSIDLSSNTALSKLYLQDNLLSSIDTSTLIQLSEFVISRNNLTDLDLTTNPALIQVLCSENNLSNFNIQNGFNTAINGIFFDATLNPNLTCIQVDDEIYSRNNWLSIDSQTDFSTNCAAITFNIPDPNFELALINLGIDTDATVNGLMLEIDTQGVTSLDVNSENISDLTGIEFFTELEDLTAFNNNLLSIDLSQNTQLISAVLAINNLTTIDLSNNPNLISISLNQNSLTSIDLSNNLSLLQVFLNDNNIDDIDVSLLASLENFGIANNNLNDLDVSQNTNLTSLFCNDNDLFSLNVQNGNNTNVTNFAAQNNPNLNCIEVDNIAYSDTNWTSIDTQSFFLLDCSPLNDDCAAATSITLAQDIPGSTANATTSGANPACQQSGLVISDVWYEFVAPASGSVTMTITAPLAIGKIALYDNCTALAPLACAQDQLQVNNLTAGQTYYLQVWLEANLGSRNTALNNVVLSQSGNFVLNVQDTTLSNENFEHQGSSFLLFPNPASNQVQIKSSVIMDSIQLFDATGKLIREEREIYQEDLSLDVSRLQNGMYFIKVSSGNTIQTQKLIIK